MNALPSQLKPIAACICAAFALGLHATDAVANTIPVPHCTEASLRSTVMSAGSNDTVSLTGLATCTITLATASIPVTVANLTITGPSANTVTISGNKLYRVFDHTKTGTLTLQHMVITEGKYGGTVNGVGGCIRSAGSVSLVSSQITDCNVKPTSGIAKGGAIYAHDQVKLTNSVVTGNIAQATGGAYGGAIFAGSIDVETSMLSDNHTQLPENDYAESTSIRMEGGAVWSKGALTSNNSVFDSNSAVGPTTKGGCALAKGTTYFGATTISNCNSYANYFAQGGGVYALGALTLMHSTLSNNHAGGEGGTYGGGLRAGSATVRYSTVHGNTLGGGPHGTGGHSQGGGMFVYQGATQITNSTLDANVAMGNGGGLFGIHSNITISNSTISGNMANGGGDIVSSSGGGIAMQATAGTAATLKISNSTIAFNQAGTSFGPYGGGGVRAYGTVIIQSSIIAKNSKHGDPNDFSCECGLPASPTVSGTNNLIMVIDPGTSVPGTFIIRMSDPLLGPLSNRGGETATHAPALDSQAIGFGNNLGNFMYDQRGFGFSRVTATKIDIGAYQRQPTDEEIFFDGFGEP
jgi:hypothetical protein